MIRDDHGGTEVSVKITCHEEERNWFEKVLVWLKKKAKKSDRVWMP